MNNSVSEELICRAMSVGELREALGYFDVSSEGEE